MNKHREAPTVTVSTARPEIPLDRRTRALAASKRLMKQGANQRKMAEQNCRKNRKHSAKLLRESHLAMQHLRQVVRRILSAHEAERTTLSQELHQEVAQTLLGVNVQLASLKRAARGNTANLKNEIVNTQRLVKESLHSINRFVRGLGIDQRGRSSRSGRKVRAGGV